MNGFYNYLESIMPVKRILISLTIGMVAFCIVLISGLKSDFVTGAIVAERSMTAFSFTALLCFIFMMSCEEYAIFKTKRELEHLIDDAPIEDVENFNREEYLHEDDDEPADDVTAAEDTFDDGAFHPLDFHAI